MVRNPLSLLHLGGMIAAVFIFFGGGGYWLDQKFETGYACTIIATILAFIYVFYIVWKALNSNGESS